MLPARVLHASARAAPRMLAAPTSLLARRGHTAAGVRAAQPVHRLGPLKAAATETLVTQDVAQEEQASVEARATATSERPAKPRTEKRGALPMELKPGSERDPIYFQQDPSVQTWSTNVPWQTNKPQTTRETLRLIARSAASADAQTASYWAYHMARFSFFIVSAAGGLATHALFDSLAPASSKTREGQETQDRFALRLLGDFDSQLNARLWEAYGTWVQDLAWIKAGVYKMPWDMVTPNKQYNPLTVASRTVNFWLDSARILGRSTRRQTESVWLQGNMYPQYYKTFHYQTDGWLSDTSASVYETSTETLFQGRQDAMQRSALVPISDYIRSRNTPLASMRLLEVAAGTGRFHTFIKDNWPELPTVCSDLSPFYLQQARSNMQEWKRMRQSTKRLGGVDDTGVEYVQMAAERLDMPDASVDIVVCVYLFHELPEAIRRKAVAEMYRVLKPGGLCVFTDSYQRGDRPEYDDMAHVFGDFNEPYYVNFVSCDFGAMFQEAGFQPQTKYMSSVTKTLSFTKPATKTYDNSSPYYQ